MSVAFPTPPPAPAPDDQVVQPFTRALIGRVLDEMGVGVLRDHDGDFLARLAAHPDLGIQLDIWFMPGGPRSGTLGIMVCTNERFSRDGMGQLLAVCNAWNVHAALPRPSVFADGPNSPTREIRLDYCLPLTEGVTRRQLREQFESVLAGAGNFWVVARTRGL